MKTKYKKKETLISNTWSSLIFNNRKYSITNVVKICRNYYIIQGKMYEIFFTQYLFNHKINKIIFFVFNVAIAFSL